MGKLDVERKHQRLPAGAVTIFNRSAGGSTVVTTTAGAMPPLVFMPYGNEPPTSNYATLDTRNEHPVLDFDGSTNESAVFSSILPRAYTGNGLTVFLHWSSDGTSGDVDWDVAFERVGNIIQNVDFDDFASVQSANDNTVPGTSGYVKVTSIPFTNGSQMDSVTGGELFRLKVTRDAASDSSTDDVQLYAVEVKET